MGRTQPDRRRSRRNSSLGNRSPRKWGKLIILVVVVVGAVLGGAFIRDELRVRSLESDVTVALAANETRAAFLLTVDHLKEFPNDHRALALQARVLVASQRPDEAHRIFSQIGAATGEDTHAWARACLLREDWQRALPLLLRVADLKPESLDVLHELTVCRMRLGRYQPALESASALQKLAEGEARGLLLKATIHSDLKNFDSAAEMFGRLIQIRPALDDLSVLPGEILTQYGGILATIGQPEEALSILERVADSEVTAVTWYVRGQAHHQLGRDGDAVGCWQKALDADPAFRQPREALADAALRRNDAEAARALLEPVLASGEPVASTAYLAQRISLRLGDRDQADHWRETAARIRKQEKIQATVNSLLIEAPGSFWAQAVRARKFALEGNWTQAESSMAVINSGKPDSELLQHAFIVGLNHAIKKRTDPPPLDQLPLTLH